MVVRSFPKLSETFIVSKFVGLVDRGWDVHVVCDVIDTEEWQRSQFLRSRRELLWPRIHRNPSRRPRWLASLKLPIVLLRCLVASPRVTLAYVLSHTGGDIRAALRNLYLDGELVRLRPDVVHFEFGTLAGARLHIGSLLGAKVVASFRGADINFARLDSPGYYNNVWSCVDAVHFLGTDLMQQAEKRGFRKQIPAWIIPPAVDTVRIQSGPSDGHAALSPCDSPVRILSVARLKWSKGHEYAMQAVRILADHGVPFEYRVIGSGAFLEAAAFCRHQLGLQDKVALLGAQTHEEVIKHLKWASIFLHAAVAEGFCNAVMEAQAAGVPVVCTDAQGLPENIQDGVTGWIVPRRSPAAIAERLLEFAGNRRMREQMGLNGRRRVVQQFSLNDQIDKWVQLYQSLAQRKNIVDTRAEPSLWKHGREPQPG
jgi:colanic acid/amylovoran biosynthesis glycosyltransferase